MKSKLFAYVMFLVLAAMFSYTPGCSDNGIINPNEHDPNSNGPLQAVISVNGDTPPSGGIDSILINISYYLSGARSTGNITAYSWSVYDYSNMQLLYTDSTKVTSSHTQTTVDTLLVRLRVRGSGGPADTSSSTMLLRCLSSYGGGTAGDIYVVSYQLTNSGRIEYNFGFPSARVLWGSKNAPGFKGTPSNWNIIPITDSVPGIWKYKISLFDGEAPRFNYMGSRFEENWSAAEGSNYKVVGGENLYQPVGVGGSIYRVGQSPSIVLPGTGDTVMRIDGTVDSLFLFTNSRWIASLLNSSTPWYEMNLYNFARRSERVSDGTGYAKISIPIALVRQFNNLIKFKFGGESVANMSGSPSYNSNSGMLEFQVASPTHPGGKWTFTKAF